jgi:hypothetical protein
MNSSLKSRLNSKLRELPCYLMGFCCSKDIKSLDSNTFVLDNRSIILNYHTLTGNYTNFIKNMLNGKVTLNESQLEDYQRKNALRVNRKFSEEAYLYSDID